MKNTLKYGPLVSVLAIILIIAGGYFLWIPEYNKYSEGQNNLEIKSGEFDRKSAYLLELDARLTALNDYSEELVKINAAIPIYDFSEVTLLSYLQKTSSENGMVLNGLEAALKKSEEDSASRNLSSSDGFWKMRDFVFNASISGTYSSFKNLLKAIYLNSRLVDVTAINFKSSDKKGLTDYDLELSAKYYLWEQAQTVSSSNI